MNHKKFFVVSLAIFVLVSLACGQNSENVKGNLVSEDATTVKVVDKVVTEQVTQKASTTDDQSSQIDNGEEGTSPKPPMVQYIVSVSFLSNLILFCEFNLSFL